MNNRVLPFFGKFLIFIGACQLLPLIIALVYGEKHQAGAFLISIAISVIVGFAIICHHSEDVNVGKLKLRESFFLVSVSWLIASLFGCIPYIASGSTDSFLYAFFETASGLTTTGATIFPRVEDLSHSILIWRALTQWLGGMGMIVLFFALLPKFGAAANVISQSETPGPMKRKITSRFSETARKLYLSYIILTVVLAILLLFGGMSAFDAMAHAFTTMATGGFSTHTGGLGYFNSAYIYAVIAIFAFLAGSNFTLYHDVIKGKTTALIKDEENRNYIIIIIVSAIAIAISLSIYDADENAVSDISAAFFQVVNTISTLGFETNNTAWPPFCIIILVSLMIIGGCSSSTAGGVKVSRFITLFKVVRKEIRQRIHETVVEDIKYNGKRIDNDMVDYILSFTVLFLVTITSGTLIVCLAGGGDVMTNLLTILSCISNLGPGLDNLGLTCAYYTNSWVCTITYTFVMIAGRLEIMPFLVLFSRHFWNSNRA